MTPVPGPHLTPDDLDAWLAGTLAPAAEEHLARCPACQERADTEREIVDAARRAAADEPRRRASPIGSWRGSSVPEPFARPVAASRSAAGSSPPGAAAALAASLLAAAGRLDGGKHRLDPRPSGHAGRARHLAHARRPGRPPGSGVRGVASNFIEQPWFAGLRALAAHPGRLGLASALAMARLSGRRPGAPPPPGSADPAGGPCRRLGGSLAAGRAGRAGRARAPRRPAPRVDPTGARTVELVHGFWTLVSDVSGRPGADDGRPDAASPAPGHPARAPPASRRSRSTT